MVHQGYILQPTSYKHSSRSHQHPQVALMGKQLKVQVPTRLMLLATKLLLLFPRSLSFNHQGNATSYHANANQDALFLCFLYFYPFFSTVSCYPKIEWHHRISDKTATTLLPTRGLPVFDGDPLHYRSFIKAFQHGIECKTDTMQDRLYYLAQYKSGQPRTCS